MLKIDGVEVPQYVEAEGGAAIEAFVKANQEPKAEVKATARKNAPAAAQESD